MKKKLAFVASIILVASFLMGSVPPDGSMGDSPNPMYSNKAIIANADTGESYELPVVTHWTRALGEGINEALISVDIPEEILEGRAGAEAWDYDSTRSVKIYVYISYSCLFDEVQYMKLSQVKGKWIQLDGDVSCTTLKVAARCYGDFYTTGFCNRYNYGNVSYPTSGVYYSLTPSWSTQYVNITYLGYSQQGITTAYLKRGISTWSATIYLGNACLW